MKKTMIKNGLIVFALLTSTAVSAQWNQLGADINGEAADNESGKSVAMSADGKTVAIGASRNDGSAIDGGHTRVFEYNGTAWVQKGLDIDGDVSNDLSGLFVAINANGSVVAIATPGYGRPSQKGLVKVYEWNGAAWVQRGSNIDGEGSNDLTGRNVALSADGNTVSFSSENNKGNGNKAGHARVYSWDGTTWNKKGFDIDGEAAEDRSGHSASMSADGNRMAIGAYFNDDAGADAGHVRVFEWDGSAWTQMGADIDGKTAQERSGQSVSLSADGSTVAIGAPRSASGGLNSGQVRVYSWNGTAWIQKGLGIDGEAEGDLSGNFVVINNDGSLLAIGAEFNDGAGKDAGHVRVFEWDGTAWAQKGADIDGVAASDNFGYSIAMSASGDTIAIGGYDNDAGGSRAGHVRIFYYGCIAPDVSITQTGKVLEANASDATFQWLDCDNSNVAVAGATAKQYTATSSGNYSVEVTQGTCVDTSTCYTVASTAGLFYDKNKQLATYPNPAKNRVYIQGVNLENSKISVRDVQGKEQDVTFSENSIDIKALSAGVYYLRIENNNSQYVSRFIKQ
jgi:hypothetical protein